jgi:hypothetical protein
MCARACRKLKAEKRILDKFGAHCPLGTRHCEPISVVEVAGIIYFSLNRPITMLPTLGKIMEKIASRRLWFLVAEHYTNRQPTRAIWFPATEQL